jgi:hypothetical protein
MAAIAIASIIVRAPSSGAAQIFRKATDQNFWNHQGPSRRPASRLPLVPRPGGRPWYVAILGTAAVSQEVRREELVPIVDTFQLSSPPHRANPWWSLGDGGYDVLRIDPKTETAGEAAAPKRP